MNKQPKSPEFQFRRVVCPDSFLPSLDSGCREWEREGIQSTHHTGSLQAKHPRWAGAVCRPSGDRPEPRRHSPSNCHLQRKSELDGQSGQHALALGHWVRCPGRSGFPHCQVRVGNKLFLVDSYWFMSWSCAVEPMPPFWMTDNRVRSTWPWNWTRRGAWAWLPNIGTTSMSTWVGSMGGQPCIWQQWTTMKSAWRYLYGHLHFFPFQSNWISSTLDLWPFFVFSCTMLGSARKSPARTVSFLFMKPPSMPPPARWRFY